jgi:hypothetical protein
MALRITLPLGKDDSIKNLVFSILTKEYPLKIVELTNLIRKRYGKSVTFQAVRKAILELIDESILIKQDKEFLINKNWLFETKKQIDKIYQDLSEEKVKPKGIDSIQGEVSVFTFDSLSEMMRFWQNIIDDWFKNFKTGDLNINAYQGAHGWEGLLYADKEKNTMGALKKKGIKSYAVSIGNTPLDRYIWKFYSTIGLKVGFSHSTSTFDKSYYIATYGETIVQAYYPKEIAEEMDKYFKKNRTIENLNLQELSDIVNKKIKIQLTVIKNISMAKQINKSIISQIEN